MAVRIKRGRKKRKDDVLFFELDDLDTIRKSMNKNVRIFNKHLKGIKKVFTKYEEPYSEVHQNARALNIKIKLPHVYKKDIELEVNPSRIVVKAESKKLKKMFYRSIEISSASDMKKMKAGFIRDHLKITIPHKIKGQ